MKKSFMLLAVLNFILIGMAYGHAHVEKSSPANNSTVSTNQQSITLQFNESVQITVLTLQKGDAPAQDLKPLPSKPTSVVTVPMPKIDEGSYIIKWRAAGDDGHIMSGKVLFNAANSAK